MEEKAKNVFDAMVEEYDAWYDSGDGRPLYDSELECLEPLAAGRPVLEVGVGTGRFAMRFPGSVGVDPSFEALKIARERGVHPNFGLHPYLETVKHATLVTPRRCYKWQTNDIPKRSSRCA